MVRRLNEDLDTAKEWGDTYSEIDGILYRLQHHKDTDNTRASALIREFAKNTRIDLRHLDSKLQQLGYFK